MNEKKQSEIEQCANDFLAIYGEECPSNQIDSKPYFPGAEECVGRKIRTAFTQPVFHCGGLVWSLATPEARREFLERAMGRPQDPEGEFDHELTLDEMLDMDLTIDKLW